MKLEGLAFRLGYKGWGVLKSGGFKVYGLRFGGLGFGRFGVRFLARPL